MTKIDRMRSVYGEIRDICNKNRAECIAIKLPRIVNESTFTIDLRDIRSDAMRERIKAAIGQDLCESARLIGESKRILTYEECV